MKKKKYCIVKACGGGTKKEKAAAAAAGEIKKRTPEDAKMAAKLQISFLAADADAAAARKQASKQIYY